MKYYALFFSLLFTMLMSTSTHAQIPFAFVSGSMAKIKAAYAEHSFIVNFWSVDCPPCFKELAMWRTLSNRHTKLVIILVNTDNADMRDQVMRVTRELGVDHLESWQFADPYTERLRYEIDKRWFGELPRTYFFSLKNKTWSISGAPERDRVEAWIKLHSPTQAIKNSPPVQAFDKAGRS